MNLVSFKDHIGEEKKTKTIRGLTFFLRYFLKYWNKKKIGVSYFQNKENSFICRKIIWPKLFTLMISQSPY